MAHQPKRGPGCAYCEGAGPEPGLIWTDNNGPTVECPMCNLRPDREREWDLAMAQRLRAQAAKEK